MTPNRHPEPPATELETLREIALRLRSIEDRFSHFEGAFDRYVEDQQRITLAMFGNPADLDRSPGMIMRMDRMERTVKAASGVWTRFRGLVYTVLGAAASGVGTWLWHAISTTGKGAP